MEKIWEGIVDVTKDGYVLQSFLVLLITGVEERVKDKFIVARNCNYVLAIFGPCGFIAMYGFEDILPFIVRSTPCVRSVNVFDGTSRP